MMVTTGVVAALIGNLRRITMKIEFVVDSLVSKEAKDALSFLYMSYTVSVKRLPNGTWLIKGER